MKKGEKNKVIDPIAQKAFVKHIFTEVYIEAENANEILYSIIEECKLDFEKIKK